MPSALPSDIFEYVPTSTQSPRAEQYRTAVMWVTFLPIVLVHALFIFTFPLNNRGGDTPNYFSMLLTGDSSLVHPSGYSFLIGLLFRHGPLVSFVKGDNPDLHQILLIVQHGIAIVAMVSLFVLVRQIYGSIAASVATLILGMNLTFMGATSATYPEWLQASLLVLAVWAAGCAYFHTSGRGKVLWYALSVTLFAWCFLVKFNVSVLAVLYVLPLTAERQPWKAKLLWSGGFALLLVSTVLGYAIGIHQPTTGTRRLTADTGWVLLTRIQLTYDNKLATTNGLATKRWLALASALPMNYEVAGAGMFSHVDAIPAELRAPYRPVFDRIATADDAFLDEWLRAHPVPAGFIVGVSPIPVCFFVGPLEGNDLAVKVAIEAVRAAPVRFVKSVWSEFLVALRAFPGAGLFPTLANMKLFQFSVQQPLSDGRVRLNQAPFLPNAPYAYRFPIVWWPGLEWFGRLDSTSQVETLTRISVAIAVVVAVVSAIARRRVTMETSVVLIVSAALTIFIIASCATLAFRWKEFCLALPLVAVLAGAGVGWAPLEVIRLVRDLKRA